MWKIILHYYPAFLLFRCLVNIAIYQNKLAYWVPIQDWPVDLYLTTGSTYQKYPKNRNSLTPRYGKPSLPHGSPSPSDELASCGNPFNIQHADIRSSLVSTHLSLSLPPSALSPLQHHFSTRFRCFVVVYECLFSWSYAFDVFYICPCVYFVYSRLFFKYLQKLCAMARCKFKICIR